jgi:metal-responsive CopG/Arc/MetJ family transcriptional regulator
MEKEFTDIAIPTSLYKKIEEIAKKKGISSVSDYIVKALNDSVSKDQDTKEAFSKEDEEKVKDRLKALGYID